MKHAKRINIFKDGEDDKVILYLRLLKHCDRDDVIRVHNDPDILRYNNMSELTDAHIDILFNSVKGQYHFGIFRETQLIGLFSLREGNIMIEMGDKIGIQKCITFGYILAKDEWNKGIMTQVVRTMISYCTTRFGIKEFIAICLPINIGSQRVLEKNGFIRTETFEGSKGLFTYSLSII